MRPFITGLLTLCRGVTGQDEFGLNSKEPIFNKKDRNLTKWFLCLAANFMYTTGKTSVQYVYRDCGIIHKQIYI